MGHAIRSVLAGSGASWEVQALTLSVAVEALAVTAFVDIAGASVPSSELVAATRGLLETPGGLDRSIRARLLGMLSGLGRLRVKDVLVALRTATLIRPQLVASYDRLRNNLAHGVAVEWAEFQTQLDRSADVVTLLHELIFLRIGYAGQYTDYAAIGWPVSTFRVRLPTQLVVANDADDKQEV